MESDDTQQTPASSTPQQNEGVHADAPEDVTPGNTSAAPQADPQPAEPRTPEPDDDASSSGDRTTVWAGALLVVALIVGGVIFAISKHTTKPVAAGTGATPGLVTTPGAVPSPTVPATPTISGGAVAAVVNGHQISTDLFRTYLNLFNRRGAGQPGVTSKIISQQAMRQTITDELLREYASAHHIVVPAAQITTETNAIRLQNGGERGFQLWLKQIGLTKSSFHTLLVASLVQQKVAQMVAPVPSAHVRHILIGTNLPGKPKRKPAVAQAKARQILQQIQHGKSFAKLAATVSDDTASGTKGGDLGNVYPREMVPVFEHAAFTLPLHKPTIVQSRFGFHIIEVLSRTSHASPPTNQQEQQAYQLAAQPAFQTWLTAQMKHSSIKRLVKVS